MQTADQGLKDRLQTGGKIQTVDQGLKERLQTRVLKIDFRLGAKYKLQTRGKSLVVECRLQTRDYMQTADQG